MENNKLISTQEMGDLVVEELNNEKYNIAIVGATETLERDSKYFRF